MEIVFFNGIYQGACLTLAVLIDFLAGLAAFVKEAQFVRQCLQAEIEQLTRITLVTSVLLLLKMHNK